MKTGSSFSNILIFHIGHLGDTLMIVPSLRALRAHYPHASFTLLSDRILGNGYVLGASLFEGMDFFDQVITFPKIRGPLKKAVNPVFWLQTGWRLRRRKFDAVAYLVPSMRRPGQIERDKRMFRLAGIRNFLGFSGFEASIQKAANPNEPWQHEADAILHRLALDGVEVPWQGQADMRLEVTKKEKENVDVFFAGRDMQHGGRIMIGFGPGSKMQAKKWPPERFIKVGKKLIASHDVWPVIFGGAEDRAIGDELVLAWGRGYNAAGALGLREAAEGLSRCILYIGNDTGTMHLAAAVSTPCVAIFSARDLKDKWNPYGKGHVVLRKNMDCAGCELEFCEHKTCLMQIEAAEVIQAAQARLAALM